MDRILKIDWTVRSEPQLPLSDQARRQIMRAFARLDEVESGCVPDDEAIERRVSYLMRDAEEKLSEDRQSGYVP